MTDKQIAARSSEGNTEKDPADWVTGDESMTGAQKSYLKTLSEEAKVEFVDTLTKAQASARIDELQQMTGRGRQDRQTRQSIDTGQSVAGEEDPGSAIDMTPRTSQTR